MQPEKVRLNNANFLRYMSNHYFDCLSGGLYWALNISVSPTWNQPLVLGVGKSGLRHFTEIGFFIGLVLWIFEVAATALHWQTHIFGGIFATVLLESIAAKIIGAILIILGFTLFVLALIAFGRSWRVGIDERTPGELVTQGIFAHSRNPIFLLIALYFIGTFLINGMLFFLIAALITVSGIHYQILQEERFLSQHYKKPYRIYHNAVGRYFTWKRMQIQDEISILM